MEPQVKRDRNFNPHSHEGATSSSIIRPIDIKYFNPHSHEGATFAARFACATILFQSTLPRGSDNDPNSFSFAFFNFNPHSHEGATHNQKQKHALIPISIHTPTRERLEKRIDRMRFEFISIHTPTRERRFIILSDRLKPILFQSTLPRGSDLIRG